VNQMKYSSLLMAALVVAGLIAIGGLLLFFLTPVEPTVVVGIERVNPLTLGMSVRGRGNEIMYVSVSSETANEELWCFGCLLPDGRRVSCNVVTYGVLPEGAAQGIPPNMERPRPLVPGETLCVRVGYQYDEGISACAGVSILRLQYV